MVDRHPVTVFFRKREQREIDDPQEIKRRTALHQVQHPGNFASDASKDCARFLPTACVEENQVVFFDVQLGDERGFFRLAEEFPQRAFVLAAFDFNKRELFDLHPGLDGDLVEPDHLTGCNAGKSLGIDGPHHPAAIKCAFENLKF